MTMDTSPAVAYPAPAAPAAPAVEPFDPRPADVTPPSPEPIAFAQAAPAAARRLLTRQMVLDADDRKTRLLSVPEWGGDVLLRQMDGLQRQSLEAEMIAEVRGNQVITDKDAVAKIFRLRLVALCLVNDDLSPMFNPHEIEVIGHKSGAVLQRIFEACLALNGMQEGDVEALAGNL